MGRNWRGFVMVAVSILGAAVLLNGCAGASRPAGQGGNEQQGSGGAGTAPVTLKVVSAWAENNSMNDALWMLRDVVKEKSQGKLVLQWGGGPEAIPAFELADSLRSGVVDVAWTAHTYNTAQIPVVEGAKFSSLTPAEERQSGAAAFYDQLYKEKLNAHYLGKGTPGLTYNLYTNFQVTKLDDFKGKAMRVTPAYAAFVEALGASSITTDPGEVYSALERKMVQGYGWPSVGIADFGWEEVTKYVIEPSFYQVDVIALVNQNAWDKLSPELQKILEDSMQEVETKAAEHFKAKIAEDRQKLQAKGLQVLKLEGDVAQQYLKVASDAGWAKVLQKDAQNGAKLQRLLSK